MKISTEEIRKELAFRELARRRYRTYLSYAHGPGWKPTRMSNYIADRVQAFVEEDTGHSYDILVIETPPQHGKSMTVTESLPSWFLGKYPRSSIIIASYNSEFAEKFCRRNKEKIKRCGSVLFGISIGGVDRAAEFELSNGSGRLISRGLMSGITGNPANLIIVDDVVKNRAEADSPTYRASVWEEWQASLKTRLSAGAKVILIMTPWHEDDIAARVLSSEPNATLLRLPVEAEEGDPLGRAVGDALCPELGKDNFWLADFKASYIHDPKGGQRAWSALYQCSPRTEGGNLVLREWWKFYHPGSDQKFGTIVISMDAAFKDGDDNDYTAIEVWGKRDEDFFLLYCMNRHLNFPNTLEALRSVSALYPTANCVLVEDAANGTAVIQTLQKELRILKVQPLGGKIARVNAISAAIESGHVYLPDPAEAPWVNDFIEQFTAFPNGPHDDMVDSCSQALNYLIYRAGRVREVRREKQFGFTEQLYTPYRDRGWGDE